MYGCRNKYSAINDITRDSTYQQYNQRRPGITISNYPGSSYWRNAHNSTCRNNFSGYRDNSDVCPHPVIALDIKNNFSDGRINSKKSNHYVAYKIGEGAKYRNNNCVYNLYGQSLSENPHCDEHIRYEEERIPRYTNINDTPIMGHYNPMMPYNMYFSLPTAETLNDSERYNY